jgi:hypothetical protein
MRRIGRLPGSSSVGAKQDSGGASHVVNTCLILQAICVLASDPRLRSDCRGSVRCLSGRFRNRHERLDTVSIACLSSYLRDRPSSRHIAVFDSGSSVRADVQRPFLVVTEGHFFSSSQVRNREV